MGQLIYGANAYNLDDRVLPHLQVVVSMKLRRGENFLRFLAQHRDGWGRSPVGVDR